MSDLYIASCTESGGIYRYGIDRDGNMKYLDKVSCTKPMYMQYYDDKMYVLLRSPFDNGESGLVVYDRDKTGVLSDPTDPVSTMGQVACHLSVSQKGIYVANYISSNVTKLPDNTVYHKGQGINPERQDAAHPHFVSITPDDKYLFVCDLGIDSVIVYDDGLNEISRARVPEGHGIRHIAFSDDGKYAFSANELKSSVSAFEYADGIFTHIHTICGIEEWDLSSASAAVRYHNGHIYISNRGRNTISEISLDKGRLEFVREFSVYGDGPRDFIIHDDYVICANEISDSVTVLRKDCDKIRLVDEIKTDRAFCITIV